MIWKIYSGMVTNDPEMDLLVERVSQNKRIHAGMFTMWEGEGRMTYIMVDDKNLKGIHGKTFEVLEETADKFVINQNGTKSWIPKQSARIMPDRFVPYDTGGIIEQTHIGVKIPDINIPKFKLGPDALDATQYALNETKWKLPKPDGYLEEWPSEPEECPVDPHNGFGSSVDNVVEKGGNNDETDALTYGIRFHPNDEMANLNELKKASELIRALRKRSTKKAMANIKMSRQIDMMEKALKEANRDVDGMIEDNNRLKEKINTITEEANERDADALKLYNQLQTVTAERDEYKKLNEYHRNEVEIGNDRREKMKYTVESLHDQLETKNIKIQAEAKRANDAERELERYKRIVDALTKRSVF